MEADLDSTVEMEITTEANLDSMLPEADLDSMMKMEITMVAALNSMVEMEITMEFALGSTVEIKTTMQAALDSMVEMEIIMEVALDSTVEMERAMETAQDSMLEITMKAALDLEDQMKTTVLKMETAIEALDLVVQVEMETEMEEDLVMSSIMLAVQEILGEGQKSQEAMTMLTVEMVSDLAKESMERVTKDQ